MAGGIEIKKKDVFQKYQMHRHNRSVMAKLGVSHIDPNFRLQQGYESAFREVLCAMICGVSLDDVDDMEHEEMLAIIAEYEKEDLCQ